MRPRREGPLRQTSPPIDAVAQEAAEDMLVALGNTDLVKEGWRPDGHGAHQGGVVGGDGAGESLCVRYLNRHLPNAQIAVSFFVVDVRERSCTEEDAKRPFKVTEMIEYYLADRPVADDDASEVWTDYAYIDHQPDSLGYLTEEAATVERDRLAAADSHEHYRWDGGPHPF